METLIILLESCEAEPMPALCAVLGVHTRLSFVLLI